MPPRAVLARERFKIWPAQQTRLASDRRTEPVVKQRQIRLVVGFEDLPEDGTSGRLAARRKQAPRNGVRTPLDVVPPDRSTARRNCGPDRAHAAEQVQKRLVKRKVL